MQGQNVITILGALVIELKDIIALFKDTLLESVCVFFQHECQQRDAVIMEQRKFCANLVGRFERVLDETKLNLELLAVYRQGKLVKNATAWADQATRQACIWWRRWRAVVVWYALQPEPEWKNRVLNMVF